MARRKEGVLLNVYDLSNVNDYLWPVGLGAYHTGVEIYGTEYNFGGHSGSSSGIFEVSPKNAPGYIFRETILLGETNLSRREVERLVNSMESEFPGNSYNILTWNCNSFSQKFSRRLLSRDIPGYISRLAYLGSMFSCFLPQSLLQGGNENSYEQSSERTSNFPPRRDAIGHQGFSGGGQALSSLPTVAPESEDEKRKQILEAVLTRHKQS